MLANARIITPSEYDHQAWNGRALVWEPPEPGEIYGIGVDPGEGVGSDNSVAQVIKMGTIKHPDVQVCEFACNFLDPIEFGEQVARLGRWYCDPDGTEAFCTIEINASCGDVMLNDMRNRLDYTNMFIRKHYDKANNIFTNLLGWSTNRSTRPKLIARGIHAFAYGDLIVNSPYLLREMQTFQRDGTVAKAKALSGKHDDRILSLLIGYWGLHDDEWLQGEDIAEDRRRAEAKQAAINLSIEEPIAEPAPKRWGADFQRRPITYAKMMELANEELFADD